MYFQQHGVHEKGLEEHYPTSSGFWTTRRQTSPPHRGAPLTDPPSSHSVPASSRCKNVLVAQDVVCHADFCTRMLLQNHVPDRRHGFIGERVARETRRERREVVGARH